MASSMADCYWAVMLEVSVGGRWGWWVAGVSGSVMERRRQGTRSSKKMKDFIVDLYYRDLRVFTGGIKLKVRNIKARKLYISLPTENSFIFLLKIDKFPSSSFHLLVKISSCNTILTMPPIQSRWI